MKKNDQGFGLVEGLLVIIIVLLVGFIGYYVWHSNKKTDNVLTTGTKHSVTNSGQSSPKPTATSLTRYLVIKEWGVKMPLDSSVYTAYYVMQSGNASIGLSIASYKGTNCAADSIGLGAIQRFTATDSDGAGSTYLADFPSALKVGNYYYQFQHPQAGCDGGTSNNLSDFSQAGADQASALTQDFKQLTTNLTTD